MGILLLIVLIIVGILFAVRIYIYENSEFYKRTGYSLFNIWSDIRLKNLYNLTQTINKLQGEKQLLFNVSLKNHHEKKLIDAILIHESGIYVIDVLNMDGWIYGREQDEEWAQALYKKEALQKFKNPIIHTKNSVLHLQEILKENPELFHAVVVFSNQCTLKKIETKSKDISVLQMSNLNHYWSNISDVKLTKEEINKIYRSLETFVGIQQPSKQQKVNQAATN